MFCFCCKNPRAWTLQRPGRAAAHGKTKEVRVEKQIIERASTGRDNLNGASRRRADTIVIELGIIATRARARIRGTGQGDVVHPSHLHKKGEIAAKMSFHGVTKGEFYCRRRTTLLLVIIYGSAIRKSIKCRRSIKRQNFLIPDQLRKKDNNDFLNFVSARYLNEIILRNISSTFTISSIVVYKQRGKKELISR